MRHTRSTHNGEKKITRHRTLAAPLCVLVAICICVSCVRADWIEAHR
jgi:hypothetical protein